MKYELYLVENPIKTTNFDLNKVTQLYVGKDDWCRCGCGGTYYKVGTRTFNRMLNQFFALRDRGCIRSVDGDCKPYLNFSIGPHYRNKAYCFYFEEEFHEI